MAGTDPGKLAQSSREGRWKGHGRGTGEQPKEEESPRLSPHAAPSSAQTASPASAPDRPAVTSFATQSAPTLTASAESESRQASRRLLVRLTFPAAVDLLA